MGDYYKWCVELLNSNKEKLEQIVKDEKIIGRSDDDTLMSKTMYTHAELMAIESACKEHPNLYGKLKGTTMYVSCYL